MRAFPSQYFHYFKNVEFLKEKIAEKNYKVDNRENIEVYYIYGKSGQDIIVFDEFHSNIKIKCMLQYTVPRRKGSKP